MKLKAIVTDFKAFAVKGNMFDIATGVISRSIFQ